MKANIYDNKQQYSWVFSLRFYHGFWVSFKKLPNNTFMPNKCLLSMLQAVKIKILVNFCLQLNQQLATKILINICLDLLKSTGKNPSLWKLIFY